MSVPPLQSLRGAPGTAASRSRPAAAAALASLLLLSCRGASTPSPPATSWTEDPQPVVHLLARGQQPGASLGHRVALGPHDAAAAAPGMSAVWLWSEPQGEPSTWSGPPGSRAGTALARGPAALLIVGQDAGDGTLRAWRWAVESRRGPSEAELFWEGTAPAAGSDACALGEGWAVGAPRAQGNNGEITLLDAAGERQGSISGAEAELAGATVAAIGDINGDGLPELMVSGWAWSAHRGRAHLFFGPVRGALQAADADRTVTGRSPWDFCGWSGAGADLNRDGYDDLAVGCFGTDPVGFSSGSVSIWPGPAADQPSGALLGPAGAQAGFSVAALPVADGAQLAVGGPGSDAGRGAVWIWDGPVDGAQTLDRAPSRLEGVGPQRGLGTRIAAPASGPARLLLGMPDLDDEAGAVGTSRH